jgi:hypothetical protein
MWSRIRARLGTYPHGRSAPEAVAYVLVLAGSTLEPALTTAHLALRQPAVGRCRVDRSRAE